MTELLTVLVTAIGSGGHGDQILKALRAAPGNRYRVVGGDANANCPQFDMVDEAVVLPTANRPEYIDAVLDVCRAFGARAVFHGCEPELLAMSRARERFEEAGLFLPINPAHVIETCMNKASTFAFLESSGFVTPKYVEITDTQSLDEIDWFPAVLKPSTGSGGSRDAFIVQDRRELERLIEYLGIAGRHFVLQEYVGDAESEYTVGVLHDMDGEFINSIAVKRLVKGALFVHSSVRNRTSRADLGEWLTLSSGVSQGQVGRYPEVTEPCEEIARALGSRGAINVQCRLVDGAVRVFEINPRFSGTTSLRAMVGYNEPDVLLRRHLLGERIEPRFSYRSALVLRTLDEAEVTEGRATAWDRIAAPTRGV